MNCVKGTEINQRICERLSRAAIQRARSGQNRLRGERERSGERTFQKTFERERNVEREATERIAVSQKIGFRALTLRSHALIATPLKALIPLHQIQIFRHVAHRLELSVKNVIDDVNVVSHFRDVINEIKAENDKILAPVLVCLFQSVRVPVLYQMTKF